MILFPIQPSNLLVTSKVHLVYFISFYLANIFPWMPGASRTHQSHINRLMAHSAWSLDGANPGAQDPCLRCSLQTHLHYKKHYTLYTSFMRTYLSHTEYIYIYIYTYIFIYRKYIRNLFFNHLYVASLRQLLLVVQRLYRKSMPTSTSQPPGSTWKIRSIPASPSWSKVFRKSIRILEDGPGVFGGTQKISFDFQGKTPWKTRGGGWMVQTRFQFF